MRWLVVQNDFLCFAYEISVLILLSCHIYRGNPDWTWFEQSSPSYCPADAYNLLLATTILPSIFALYINGILMYDLWTTTLPPLEE